MRRTVFLIAVLAVSGARVFAQEPSPYDTTLERLVQSLVSSLPEEAVSQHPRIAVGCFVCGDGKVTLGEVIEYTRDQVKRFTCNQQHPDTAGLFNRNLPMGVVK
ncbi:MAG TPA: hypothetical protein VNA25_26285 [Phycisphaerae bacterium]|nr:hypothetical protein [Phycisphaerae bacterium]